MTPLSKWKWQIPLGIVFYHFKMYLTTLSFFSLVKVEECGYIFFHPDIKYPQGIIPKGWRISIREKVLTCENGDPDCGDYYYRSTFFMN